MAIKQLKELEKNSFLVFSKNAGRGVVELERGTTARWNEDAVVLVKVIGWASSSSIKLSVGDVFVNVGPSIVKVGDSELKTGEYALFTGQELKEVTLKELARKRNPMGISRNWTDSSGGFSVEAEFVAYEPARDERVQESGKTVVKKREATVRLLKADGQEIAIPLKQLCVADRKHVLGLQRELLENQKLEEREQQKNKRIAPFVGTWESTFDLARELAKFGISKTKDGEKATSQVVTFRPDNTGTAKVRVGDAIVTYQLKFKVNAKTKILSFSSKGVNGLAKFTNDDTLLVRGRFVGPGITSTMSGTDFKRLSVASVPNTNAKLLLKLAPAGYCMDVAFTADERTAVSVDLNGKIRRWNTQTHENSLVGEHGTRVDHVTLSRDGRVAFTGGSANDRTIIAFRMWDVQKGAPIGEPVVLGVGWLDVKLSADDTGLFVTGGSKVRWYRCKTNGEEIPWDETALRSPVATAPGNSPIVASPTHPDRAYFVDANDTDVIILWDFDSQKEVTRFETFSDRIGQFSVSADGKRLIVRSDDLKTRIWNAQTGDLIKALPTNHSHENASSVAFSPDGKSALIAIHESLLQEWDVDAGIPLSNIGPGHAGSHHCYYLSDGKRVLVASIQGLELWEFGR